jgi:hypothetical protein
MYWGILYYILQITSDPKFSTMDLYITYEPHFNQLTHYQPTATNLNLKLCIDLGLCFGTPSPQQSNTLGVDIALYPFITEFTKG